MLGCAEPRRSWTALELPNGPATQAAVMSENSAVHVVFTIARQEPATTETLHWVAGAETAERIEAPSLRTRVLSVQEGSYSAVRGATISTSGYSDDRSFSTAWNWSPTSFNPLYVCRRFHDGNTVTGAMRDGVSWAQRSESMACTEPESPFRAVRCPGDGFGLFRAGDTSIRCPFSAPELIDLARKHESYIAESAMHPIRRVASFNGVAFYSFDEDGGLVDYALTPDAGDDHFGQIRYFKYFFWPTDDLPYRRVGVANSSFEVLSWIDGGVVVSSSSVGARFSWLESVVETSKGVVVHGKAADDSAQLLLLLSFDGSTVLGATTVESSQRLRILETADGIFAFRTRSAARDGGDGLRIEFSRLDFE